MSINHKKCLVLNGDYSPLCVISWKKAVVWSIKNSYNQNIGIQIIDFYKNDHITVSNGKKIPVPAVAKTSRYKKYNHLVVNFSRKNLFMRDDYICQYCGISKELSELTYDHVIPKSQWDYNNGTPTNWTNIVTACLSCNRKKGNKTPKQANMPLLDLPYRPTKTTKYLPLHTYLSKIKEEIPVEWNTYLPASYLS
jgi:5-methylcytosine-specific restriction endonuclease McrA